MDRVNCTVYSDSQMEFKCTAYSVGDIRVCNFKLVKVAVCR